MSARDALNRAAIKAAWERDEANANGNKVRGSEWEKVRADLREAQSCLDELIAAARLTVAIGRPAAGLERAITRITTGETA